MPAYGYELHPLVFNSISHEWTQRTSEISSWTLEDKIRIYARACNFLYMSVIHEKKIGYRIKMHLSVRENRSL